MQIEILEAVNRAVIDNQLVTNDMYGSVVGDGCASELHEDIKGCIVGDGLYGDGFYVEPYNPWDGVPYPFPIVPYQPCPIVPWEPGRVWPSTTTILMGLSPSNWRVNESKKGCRLSRDIPGVRAKDINLTFNDGVITLSARRFDTNDPIVDTYNLGEKYDPDTFEATLESGVLTVTVKVLLGRGARKITVKDR